MNASSMAYRWNALQLQGDRERQEDTVLAQRVLDSGLVLAIGDGLGGHPHGDWASQTACRTVVDTVSVDCENGSLSLPLDADAWRSAFLQADRAVRTLPADRISRPATTLIAATLDGEGLCSIAGVGDSSVWIFGTDGLRRVLERRGEGSWVQNCLGYLDEGDLGLQVETLRLKPDDRLIFATDGIETLRESDLLELFRLRLDLVVGSIARAINDAEHPDQDNVTVLVLEVAR